MIILRKQKSHGTIVTPRGSCLNIKHFGWFLFFGSFTVSVRKYSFVREKQTFKGATKSYFTHYSCVVIVFFNTDLCRSAFSTVSFRKLVFLCFLWIKTLKYASSCYVILIYNFVLTLYKNSPFINNKLFMKILQYYM